LVFGGMDGQMKQDGSGGASAAKELGHFEVRTSSSQVTRMHFFPQKSWRPFLVVALKTRRPPTPLRLFSFSVHTITEAKQSNRQSGARSVDLPILSFDLACPGDIRMAQS